MFNRLDLELVYDCVNAALDEDVGRGDITSRAVVRSGARARASFTARETFILAGIEAADAAFSSFDPYLQIESMAGDGDRIEAGKVFARATGDAQTILVAERVALNFLRHLSGIATVTHGYVEAVAGTSARIIDTRHTTPGLRLLEKYAVTVGGGLNHRTGLDDGVLIERSHLILGGGITDSVRRVREAVGHLHRVEVVVSGLDEVREALTAKADILRLEVATPELVGETAALIRKNGPNGSGEPRVLITVGGPIDPGLARQLAEAGADLIAIDTLTEAVIPVAIDLGIKSV